MFEEVLKHFELVVAEFDDNVEDSFGVMMHDEVYDQMHQCVTELRAKEDEVMLKKVEIEGILNEARAIQ